jgi:hypothetical protein
MQDEYGLVSYWNFEPQLSDTGFANDTQKANNGTVNGGATLTPDGRIGHAYSFDGNNDYIDVGTGSSLYPSTFTLEAWIKGTSSASPRGIFSVGYNEGANQGVYLIANTDNSLNFQVYDGSDAVGTTTAVGLITNDVWHHVATTFDGSNTEVYVDGIVKATNTQDPVEFDTNTNVYIGTYSSASWRFSGTIDEARIYKRALSAEEIEYSYLKGKSFFDKSQNLTIGSDDVVVDVTSGYVGIGTASPTSLLTIGTDDSIALRMVDTGDSDATLLDIGHGDTYGAFISMKDDAGNDDVTIRAYANPSGYGSVFKEGNFGIGTTTPGYPLEVACATTTWTDRGSSISCSDYAEVYEHSEKKEDLESGQVLVLDSENEGKVKISTKSHDKMVVGVVSGSPGMLIGIGDSVGIGGIDANNLDNKSLPMSLSGKVIVQVIGDVKIGDLLTTSDARGKAMACSDHEKCQGAILGKAMTNDKKGEVLALITLQ